MTRRSPLNRPGQMLKAVLFAGLFLTLGLAVLVYRKGMPTGHVVDPVGSHPLARAGAEILQGGAHVVDGDTLLVGNRRVRLFGIDAPESAQTCLVHGSLTKIGYLAAHHLRQLTDGRMIVCYVADYDQYGRAVAVCEADQVELNYAMVRDGWARAYTNFSKAYISVENRARSGAGGFWACSTQIEPWAYRQQARDASGARR